MPLQSKEAVFVKREPDSESEDACGVGEAAARVQGDWLIDHEFKDEQDWANEADACGVSEAAAREGLYKDHQVKDELVLGPELLQPPDAVFALQGQMRHQEQSIHEKTNKSQLCVSGGLKKGNTDTAVEQEASASNQGCSETDAAVSELPVVKHLTASETKEMSDHKSNSHFTCNSCSRVFETKLMLLQHKRTLHGQKRSLLRHEKIHTGEKPYKCIYCSFASANRIHLVTHERIHTGEKPYKCTHCSYASTRRSSFIKHERIHTGEKPYKCTHCSYASSHRSCLVVHERKHTGEKPYKCTYCSYATTVRTGLLRHKRIHAGEKPYKCAHCSYASAQQCHLVIHERKHTGAKPYKCGHCSYASARKCHLLIHERKHSGAKPYQMKHDHSLALLRPHGTGQMRHQHQRKHEKTNKSQLCVRDGLKKENTDTAEEQEASASNQGCSETDAAVGELPVDKHITANETKEVSDDKSNSHFTCNSCSRAFETELMLIHHKRTLHSQKCRLLRHERMHTGEKPYKCTHCSYASTSGSDLLRHEKIHTDKEPYKCAYCSYTCSYKSYFIVHERKHTGEKPYKCTHCSYASTNKSDLLRHEKIHTGEKPYKCTLCSYASYNRRDLLRHEKIHTGEKPYKCTLCSYASINRSDLLRHEKIHTGKIPYECATNVPVVVVCKVYR